MYSNCLFEALKAKIKNPKHVHVFSVPRYAQNGQAHFMWYNDETGLVGHAFSHTTGCNLLFRPTIKYVSVNVVQRWLLGLLGKDEKRATKFAKRLNLPLLNVPGVLSYKFFTTDPESFLYEEGLEPLDKATYETVKRVLGVEPQIKIIDVNSRKMSITDFEGLKKSKGSIEWKFITPFDSTFKEIYTRGLVKESEITGD